MVMTFQSDSSTQPMTQWPERRPLSSKDHLNNRQGVSSFELDVFISTYVHKAIDWFIILEF